MLVPVSQSIGALSEENRPSFEANLMQMIERLFELSDIDFAKQAGQRIDDRLFIEALKAAYMQIADQNKAIAQLQQLALSGLPQGQPQQPQQQAQSQTIETQPVVEQPVEQPQPVAEQVPIQGTSQLPPEVMQQLMAQQQVNQQQTPPATEEEELMTEQV